MQVWRGKQTVVVQEAARKTAGTVAVVLLLAAVAAPEAPVTPVAMMLKDQTTLHHPQRMLQPQHPVAVMRLQRGKAS